MIAALLPAHNEAATIGAAITELRAQGIARIIAVCDGCTDDTAEVARDAGAEVFETAENTARKAGALNQAIEWLAPTAPELVLVQDADTVLHPGWVEAALAELADTRVGAVGAIFEADQHGGWLRRCQSLEWHRFAGEVDRTGRTFVLSGTAALIRWEAIEGLQEAQGHVYDESAITEDFRLTTALLGQGWILRSPDACRVTTETMPTLGDLFRQRRRWSLGALQVVSRTRGPHMRVYRRQQAMLLLSVLAMGLLALVTLAALLWGTFTLSPFWLAVGAIFAVERVVTVWDRPLADRVFAGLVLPELAFALVLQAAHLAAIHQYLTRSTGSWGHVQKELPCT